MLQLILWGQYYPDSKTRCHEKRKRVIVLLNIEFKGTVVRLYIILHGIIRRHIDTNPIYRNWGSIASFPN